MGIFDFIFGRKSQNNVMSNMEGNNGVPTLNDVTNYLNTDSTYNFLNPQAETFNGQPALVLREMIENTEKDAIYILQNIDNTFKIVGDDEEVLVSTFRIEDIDESLESILS